MTKPKCECPLNSPGNPMMDDWYLPEEKAGMVHRPGKCKGTYRLKPYRRGTETLWLCSCCCLPGDVEVNN